MVMKSAGMAGVNPSNPKLTALLEAGITVPELVAAAADAVAKGKPFAYALASADRRKGILFAPANLVPRRWQGPIVLVVHDTFCEHYDAGISRMARLRFRSRYRRSALRADLILVPSESTASDVRQFYLL